MTFTRIKIDKADKEFSRYIRLRDQRCQRCLKPGSGEEGINGLQASHFHGRRKESVRFDVENVTALCSGCHQYLGSNPDAHRAFMLKRLGEEKYNALNIRAHTYRGKDRKYQLLRAKALIQELKKIREVA